MAKLPVATCSQAVESDLWSILLQWSNFYLVITFQRRVTIIFVKIVLVSPCKFELSKMDAKSEQRSVIKFCRQLKKSAVQTVKLMHEAHTDEEWFGDSIVFHRHKAFSEGIKTDALLSHVGWPLSICTEEMANTIAVVQEYCHVTDNLLKCWIFQNHMSIWFCGRSCKCGESQSAGFLFSWLENREATVLRFVVIS